MTSIPYFYIFKDHANEWRWRFNASNDEVIATSSRGYHKFEDCEQAIKLLSVDAKRSVTIGDRNYVSHSDSSLGL